MTEEEMTDDQTTQEQAAKESTEAKPDEQITTDSALLIFIQNGEAFGVGEIVGTVKVRIENKVVELTPLDRADMGTMYRACMEVAKDVQVAETAQKTATMMMQITAQMQQQMQAQKIAQQTGLQVPGR